GWVRRCRSPCSAAAPHSLLAHFRLAVVAVVATVLSLLLNTAVLRRRAFTSPHRRLICALTFLQVALLSFFFLQGLLSILLQDHM
ncbi:unnamed protein product, partial [Urochloa humidicola]